MANKEKTREVAREVAIEEVNKRIVTKAQAKEDFVKWIKKTRSSGGFDKHIIDFWDEVIKQVSKV